MAGARNRAGETWARVPSVPVTMLGANGQREAVLELAILTCPLCRRYSSQFTSVVALNKHYLDVHPSSDQARALKPTVRKGYGQK